MEEIVFLDPLQLAKNKVMDAISQLRPGEGWKAELSSKAVHFLALFIRANSEKQITDIDCLIENGYQGLSPFYNLLLALNEYLELAEKSGHYSDAEIAALTAFASSNTYFFGRELEGSDEQDTANWPVIALKVFKAHNKYRGKFFKTLYDSNFYLDAQSKYKGTEEYSRVLTVIKKGIDEEFSSRILDTARSENASPDDTHTQLVNKKREFENGKPGDRYEPEILDVSAWVIEAVAEFWTILTFIGYEILVNLNLGFTFTIDNFIRGAVADILSRNPTGSLLNQLVGNYTNIVHYCLYLQHGINHLPEADYSLAEATTMARVLAFRQYFGSALAHCPMEGVFRELHEVLVEILTRHYERHLEEKAKRAEES